MRELVIEQAKTLGINTIICVFHAGNEQLTYESSDKKTYLKRVNEINSTQNGYVNEIIFI